MTQENRRAMNFAKDAESGQPIVELLKSTRDKVEETAGVIMRISEILNGPIEEEPLPEIPGNMADELRLVLARCERISKLANKALKALIG